jgi:biotin carboxyl carrier protein
MHFSYQTPTGETKYIQLTPQGEDLYSASIEGRVYRVEVRHQDENQLFLILNGEEVLLKVARAGLSFFVAFEGEHLRLEKASRGKAKSSAGDLTASMPGQVVEVQVEPGQHVEKGQTLVILEAMKMELRVKAPHDGTVRRVLCVTGQTVEQGQLLVELG